MSGPYADAGPVYHRAGWSPIPLPPGQKVPPLPGWTGYSGARPSGADVYEWATNGHGGGNIGLRLPDDVVGVDVDDYAGKCGGATLTALEAELGPLPLTARSTSRLNSDPVSGIRLYRVDPGHGWADPGPGIEVLHAGWRYVVAQPSIHPEGRDYVWIDDRTGVIGEVPSPADVPDLPASWVEHMRARPGTLKAAVGDAGAAGYLAALPDGEPCRYLARLVAEFGPALASGKARHDVCNDYVGRVVRGGEQGHRGAPSALETVHAAFRAVVDADPKRRPDEREFKRSVVGAVGLVKASPTADVDRGCCGPRPGDPVNEAGTDDTDSPPAGREKKSAATLLVELALDRYRLGMSEGGAPFAVPRTAGPGHVARLLRGGQGSLRAELAEVYFDRFGKGAPAQALADALLVLEGTGVFI